MPAILPALGFHRRTPFFQRISRSGFVAAILGLLAVCASVTPATASDSGLPFVAGPGRGAISVKGPDSELVPGATVEIRRHLGSGCTGAPVWRTTTGRSADAYGAFAISLPEGIYCAVALDVPYPYEIAEPRVFTFYDTPFYNQWSTIWLRGPVAGALVAKDGASSAGVNGVIATIREGTCDAPGRAVWRNTTSTNRWSSGGFGISLPPGTYCTEADDVPGRYDLPDPVQTTVTRPGPVWITLWMPRAVYGGIGPSTVSIDVESRSRVAEFSCPDCVGQVQVSAVDDDGFGYALVDAAGPQTITRAIIGADDPGTFHYGYIDVVANGHWALALFGADDTAPR